MSAAYAPEPDDRRDDTPPALSSRDHRILDEIAGYENGSDPTFVARLRTPARRTVAPATERVIQVLVVAGVIALFLPVAWVMVGVVLTVLIVVPGLLAWYGHRLQGQGPQGRAPEETT